MFTRGLVDKLLSFVVFGRSTYTAATRQLAADVQSFRLRRRDVVKLGTVAAQSFTITPETARCPICGPKPKLIVIDAQALWCTDLDDTHPFRPGEDCPSLPIDASKLCIVMHAPLQAAIDKVLGGAKELTENQVHLFRLWGQERPRRRLPTVEAAAADVFFHLFPVGSCEPPAPAGEAEPPAKKAAIVSDSAAAAARPDKRMGLQAALRQEEEGNLVLGGPGKPVTAPVESWRDRVGACAPAFTEYLRDDDLSWLSAVPFLKAMLSESVTGMFKGHDERALKLSADALMHQGRDAWREANKAVDGVGFVASFIGSFADEIDVNSSFRVALGTLLNRALEIEKWTDDEFTKVAFSDYVKSQCWKNAEYCAQCAKTPTPADFAAWRRLQPE